MITQAQAQTTAARWLNPEGHQGPPREVALQEFDLGWVVWAVPSPPEVDPATGQRRPPAEIGAAYGVVDRSSGELTVWPSIPVDEVVRRYRQQHGTGSGTAPAAPAEPPVTGPGNTAVATYPDPATGEETTLARVSAPGLPPVEYQLHDELRRLGVRPADVRAFHTDLRSALLPGGYPADFVLRTFPNAAFTCTEGYGMRPEERAEGVAGLLRHVELMHGMAGRPAPPRPHRIPVPQDVAAAPAVRDVALGKHLVEVFGPEGVHRPDADDLAATPLPQPTKNTVTWSGLPTTVPFFFTADRPDTPPAGGLFTDVATHLCTTGTQAREQTLATLAGYVRIGTDGLYTLAVQCVAPENNQNLLGTVWAVQPTSGGGRFVNRTLPAYLRSLALLATTRRQMPGMDPYAAGATVAAFQEQLAAIDSWALDDDGNWWSLIIEQMWHGLF
ncbi:SUKH-4 family immunity protein [Streptomyces sioyaensis]|uniref:SUKH-4 family immunity protein n=1 Tax=Streptomyces sioyaensis TaxID=67364 RepID=UPI001F36BE02|nr:SUKH-4 family immunity protein [Streptomyces sioyaensis]MCF3175390.1 SUKH-4 family immunity protein [Streptomyces sioyaensis]